MNITNNKKTSYSFLKKLLTVSLLVSSSAAYSADTVTTKSISYLSKTETDIAEKNALLNNSELKHYPALIKQGFREEAETPMLARYTSSDVTLYDASTTLISDINHDGFYHRFSVTMDIDTIYTTAYVYTKIYLSYEGGPWNHITTSDSFHIHGDSELDTFTVETELADGFDPGYYDIRIVLYDGDFHTRIASYGPYDDASLGALPLEDSYLDDYPEVITPIQTEVIITSSAHGHGALGFGLLALPLVVLMRRLHHRNQTILPVRPATTFHNRLQTSHHKNQPGEKTAL